MEDKEKRIGDSDSNLISIHTNIERVNEFGCTNHFFAICVYDITLRGHHFYSRPAL
jgi:hypothetical protein